MFKLHIRNLLIAFIVLFSLNGIASATNSTIYNGDFETGDTSGWNEYENGILPDITVDANYKYEGDYGISLVAIADAVASINQTINATDRHTLTYYYKVHLVEGSNSNSTISVNGDVKKTYTSAGSWTADEISLYGYTGDVLIEFNVTSESGSLIAVHYDSIEASGPPELYTPANTTTISGTFPPLAYDVDFAWESLDFYGYDSYKYQIARDAAFNVMVAEEYTTNNYTTIALTDDDYWWRVANYNSTSEEVGNWSSLFSFDVDLTAVGVSGTNIDGIVYEVTAVGDVAVDNAIVYIYNTTWSSQQITGSNGYYQFTGLENDTYSIQATKQGYVDSNVELVTTVFDDTITKNILIERRTGAGDQYDFHYVKYIVKNIFDNRYSGVDVEVFENGDVVSIFTAETGTDGAVTFILNRDQEYRLEFTSANQGIDEEIIHYPKDEQYNVYVITKTLAPDEQYSSEEIDISVSKELINNSHAYINVTYLDNLAETESLKVYLNQSTTNDLFNQTVIDSYSNAINSTVISFIVEDYAGETYFVNVDVDHTTFDKVKRSYAVQFDGMTEDHGFSQVYIWLAIGGIMFTGMLFKANNARYGAFVVCIIAWVFIIMEWIDNLGDKGVLAITAATTLATILSIAAIMAKGEKEG